MLAITNFHQKVQHTCTFLARMHRCSEQSCRCVPTLTTHNLANKQEITQENHHLKHIMTQKGKHTLYKLSSYKYSGNDASWSIMMPLFVQTNFPVDTQSAGARKGQRPRLCMATSKRAMTKMLWKLLTISRTLFGVAERRLTWKSDHTRGLRPAWCHQMILFRDWSWAANV